MKVLRKGATAKVHKIKNERMVIKTNAGKTLMIDKIAGNTRYVCACITE